MHIINIFFFSKNLAVMHIYYEDNFFRSNTKEELIGFTEFLCYYSRIFFSIKKITVVFFFIVANTGGLLSLFMGFSVVSLIEILYFLTIRPYCAARIRNKTRGKKRKSGNKKANKLWRQEKMFIAEPSTTIDDHMDKRYIKLGRKYYNDLNYESNNKYPYVN